MSKVDKDKERAIAVAFGELGALKPPPPEDTLNDRLSSSLDDLDLFGKSKKCTGQ